MANLYATASTKFGELWNSGIEEIAKEAIEKVSEQSKDDPFFDKATVFFGSSVYPLLSGDTGFPLRVMQKLQSTKLWQSLWGDETIGARVFALAWQQVALGIIPSAIVCAVDKTTDWKQNAVQEALSSPFSPEERLQGMTRDAYFGILAQKYLTTNGVTADCLAMPMLVAHQNAMGNKDAQFSKAITREQIARTPYLASPLRMLHGTAPADGAVAVYITSSPKSNRFHCAVSSFATSSTEAIANLSFSSGGVGEKRIVDTFLNATILDISDYYAILPILALEEVGIAPRGKASSWIENAGKGYNPDGGCKAYGDPPGASALRQIVSVYKAVENGSSGVTISIGALGTQAIVSRVTKTGEGI